MSQQIPISCFRYFVFAVTLHHVKARSIYSELVGFWMLLDRIYRWALWSINCSLLRLDNNQEENVRLDSYFVFFAFLLLRFDLYFAETQVFSNKGRKLIQSSLLVEFHYPIADFLSQRTTSTLSGLCGQTCYCPYLVALYSNMQLHTIT